MRWFSVLCLGLLLAAGCGDDAKRTHTPALPVYLANTSPDSVLANLVTAWAAMDADGYAALLYDGSGLGRRDENFPGFSFYFDQSTNPELPASWGYAEEIACVAHLLGGSAGQIEPGRVLPGVASVSMTLTPQSEWAPVDEDPPGQDCPEGTQRMSARIWTLLELEDKIDDTGIVKLLVDELAVFHAIQVVRNERIEYRLWKWSALPEPDPVPLAADGDGDTENVPLGIVKNWYQP